MAIRVDEPSKEETLQAVTLTTQLEPRNNLILEVTARDKKRTKRYLINLLVSQLALTKEQDTEIAGLLADGKSELKAKG